MGRGSRAIVAVLSLVALATACSGGPPPGAPSAVIHASPSTVCTGDAFMTPITLDATRSTPHLTLVAEPPDPKEPPLRFSWSFAGADVHVMTGDPAKDATLVVAIAGDRPLHVTVHVENGEGGATDALTTVAVTPLDATGACPLPPVTSP
jgi:hypothetical protein